MKIAIASLEFQLTCWAILQNEFTSMPLYSNTSSLQILPNFNESTDELAQSIRAIKINLLFIIFKWEIRTKLTFKWKESLRTIGEKTL